MTAHPFDKVDSSVAGYIDYEYSIELPVPAGSPGESIVLRFCAGHPPDFRSYYMLMHEVDGDFTDLGTGELPRNVIRKLMREKDEPVDVLKELSAVNGNVSIHDGIAVLPDGSTLDLRARKLEESN